MKLYVNQSSPYARKVRVVAKQLGLNVALVDVDPWVDPPELLAVSPLSKVPVLVTDGGLVITESDTIARHLCDLAAAAALFPADLIARAEVAARMALLQGMIDAAFDAVIEKRRPAVNQWPDWIERQVRAVQRGLNVVAAREMPAGRFDLGDISLACLLGYLDFRHPSLAWRSDHANLAAWYDQTAKRASLATTRPDVPIG